MQKKVLLILIMLISVSRYAAGYPVADASFPPDRAESRQVRAEPSIQSVKPSPQARKSDLIEKFLRLIRPWLHHSA